MSDLTAVLMVVWLHFIADFILQTDRVAMNKSKSNTVLLWHVFLYGLPFLAIGWKYALLNSALHFVIDWPTCRATSWLYQRGKRHWFFVVIGLDQAIHITCLISTLALLGISFNA